MPRFAKGISCFYFSMLCFSSFSEYNLSRKKAKRSEGNEGEQANSATTGPHRKYYVLHNHPDDDESVDEL